MTTQTSLLKTADALHSAAKTATGPAEAVSAMMLAAATLVVEHTPADKVQDTILELMAQFAKFAKVMLDYRNPVPQQSVAVVPPKVSPKKPTPITVATVPAPEEPTPEKDKDAK